MGNIKGVSEIISVVLILLMSAGLIGTALNWGLPLISKQQDTTLSERVYAYFDRNNLESIGKKIEFVSKNGGQATFTLGVNGIWAMSSDSLEFTFFSKVSNIAPSTDDNQIGWISMTPGGECPPESGIVGADEPYVICAKSEPYSDGFNITYRLWFRDLYDSSDTKIWRLNVVQHPSGSTSKVTKTVRIIEGDVTTSSQSGKTLIIKDIKILLV